MTRRKADSGSQRQSQRMPLMPGPQALLFAVVAAAVACAASASMRSSGGGVRSLHAEPTTGAPAPVAAQTPECAAALAKDVIVVFSGPEEPYLRGEVRNLMPGHTIDVTPGTYTKLDLADPTQAACAASITSLSKAQSLLIWDNGSLGNSKPCLQASLPRGLVRPLGQIVVLGKPGKEQPGITSLDFLQSLQSVGGLSVYNMDGLKHLTGLEALYNITGDLIISENDALLDCAGLDALRAVGGDLLMNSNQNLLTLKGLSALESIGGQLLLKGNGYMMSADELSSLRRIGKEANLINNGNLQMTLPAGVAVGPSGTLTVSDGPAGDAGVLVIYGGDTPPSAADVFESVNTFQPPLPTFDITVRSCRFLHFSKPAVTEPDGTLKGNVVVYDTGNIPDLRAVLGGVTAITGALVVIGGWGVGLLPSAPGLANLDGCQGITSVGSLGLVATTQLRNLKELSSLTRILGNLVVSYNAQLKSLEGLGPEVQELGLVPSSGTVDLGAAITSLRGLRAAPGGPRYLNKIASELWIQDNAELETLSGLEGVAEVDWRIQILYNKKLTTLDALSRLTKAGGGLVIIGNKALTSLGALKSLTDVGISAHIMWNPVLRDVSGLAQLTAIRGDLVLAGNKALSSLAPLIALQQIGLNLCVSNTNITDLTGLDNLVSVGGLVSINENPELRSLKGLGALGVIGDNLQMHGNPRLASLAPLDSVLTSVGGGLYLLDNPQLASLGRLPATLTRLGAMVDVRNSGAVPATDIAVLRSKANKGLAAVLDTVELLPQTVATAGAQFVTSATVINATEAAAGAPVTGTIALTTAPSSPKPPSAKPAATVTQVSAGAIAPGGAVAPAAAVAPLGVASFEGN
ncbi:hypothetical protein V8C86DRAFT_976734 [Haematococcus lacustris]